MLFLPVASDLDTPSGGHAVALVDWEEPNVAIFQNWWGDNWAAGGKFKVDLDGLSDYGLDPSFYDVFFFEADLSDDDRAAYRSFKVSSHR